MKISWKLITIFSLLSLLLLVIGLVSLLTQERLTKDFEEYVGKILPGVIAAEKVETELYRAKNYAAEYALTKNSEYAQKTRDSLQGLTKYAAVHRVYHSDHGNPEELVTVDTIVEAFTSYTMEYMLLVDKGASAEELDIVKKKMDSEISDFAFSIRPYIEQKITSVKEREITLKQGNDKARSIIMGIVALGLIIGIVLSFAAFRVITTQIERLIDYVQIMGTGKIGVEIDPKLRESKDEIGDLARAFDQMTKDLHEITVSRDQLEVEIRERKQAEEELIKSEELLKATGKTALVGGWSIDVPSKEWTVTEEIYSILEIEPEDDRNIEDGIALFTPEHQPIIRKALQMVVEKGEPYDLELELITAKGNQRWVHVIGEAQQENGKIIRISGTIQDITIQKENEIKLEEYSEHLEQMVSERTQALEKAQEELIRKEKLAILGQMAGSIAHELRNPLGMISNSAYYLGMVLTDSEEGVRESLDMINEEIQKSDKIITDLLNFSRGRVSEPQKAALSSLVEDVLASQPPPQDIELSIQIARDLPRIFIDIQQIGQVLTNLVVNAYQAMPDGGKLGVKALAENGSIKLTIADSGCGISKENMKLIFDPLFTTKTRGVGLGLAISKNFAEANGATIEVESQEGEGTRFTIVFPAISAA